MKVNFIVHAGAIDRGARIARFVFNRDFPGVDFENIQDYLEEVWGMWDLPPTGWVHFASLYNSPENGEFDVDADTCPIEEAEQDHPDVVYYISRWEIDIRTAEGSC